MYGIDLSNYQDAWDESCARYAFEQGIGFAIIGLQDKNNWRRQMEICRAAGMQVAAYCESMSAWPDLPDYVRYVAVAVEAGSGFQTIDAIDNAILWIGQQPGKTALIYTSAAAWGEAGLSGVTKYAEAGIGLWNAHYTRQPNGRRLRVPFGGWTENVIDQYDAWGYIPGVPFQVDMDESNLFDNPEEGDVQTEPMSQGETIAAANSIFARFGNVITDDQGETMLRVISPPPPPGFTDVIIRFKEGN